jgi:DNA-repair protein XRCC2
MPVMHMEALLSPPSESLTQFLTAVRVQSLPPLLPALHARSGDVIEVQGAPGSGKTHLLYHFIITCILPPFHNTVSLGGWGKAACLFDSEWSFDIRRFKTLLLSRLQRLLPDVPSTTVQEIAAESLKILHIFRPESSNQLTATLIHLPAYHTKNLPHHEIGMIAIDAIGSFYWIDRFTVEHMAAAQSTFVNPLHHVLSALQSLRVTHGMVFILVNWGLNLASNPSAESSSSSIYKQHLVPFPSLSASPAQGIALPLNYHITLSSPAAPQFSADEPVEAPVEQYSRRFDRCEVVGIIRIAEHSSRDRFVLSIRSDDLVPG